MAINIAVFKTRALTALIFVGVMMFGLLGNRWTFLTLFAIIHFGCWIEFVKLLKRIYGVRHLRFTLSGLLYITLPICLMVDLRTNFSQVVSFPTAGQAGNTIPMAIIFSIWVNDTMAYLVGSFIGKTPLSKISPKKTWEGTVGGMVLCMVIIGVLYPLIAEHFFYPGLHRSVYVIIAAICAIAGTFGDLLESKIKRLANVKDSGSIMPGHGGFLDRFDSLLVATVFVWIYVKLFV